MKNILGLDLGTTSIGFAHIVEDENKEKSEIKELGVRIVSLTTDEQSDFEKGKSISTNANRTLKHGARLNLDRYQQRRKYLIDLLQKANLITPSSILAENGKNTTHSTWQLRAKAVTERIEKEEFARVLLAINKKRGYKSSRKYNPQNEMYQKLKRNVHFLRWLNGAKVIKNTDRLGAYPCFFIYYAFITYRVTLIDRVCKCLLLQYLVQRCLHLGVGVFWCICHWLLR